LELSLVNSVSFITCSVLQGKNESLRARAILRSLVPLEDLRGVLSVKFTLQNPPIGEDGPQSDMPSGLIPAHKQSVVLFLERVYGIEDKELFFKAVMSDADPEPNDALDKAGRLYQEYFSQS
jgi:ryanodine receptor 2